MPLSAEAVLRAQRGDARAREALLTALEGVLRGYFRRRIGARDEVDDLVQNTLLRVHQGLSDLKDPERLRAFALKGALFELQDFYRGRYTARETLYDPETAPPESPDLPTEGAGIDAERVLAMLPERARRMLELRAYGYRYEEIAGMIGTTEAAVKMQVKRTLDKIRGLALSVLAALGLGAAMIAGGRG